MRKSDYTLAMPLCAAIAAALILACYPGLVPPDALFQYVQLKSGQISDLHPPVMIWIWQVTDRLIPGPGGLYLLSWAIYSVGALICARHLFASGGMRVITFLLLVSPPVLTVMISVWKDSLLIGMMIMTVATLMQMQSGRRQWIGFALTLAAIWMAASLRHNALPALLPFLLLMMPPQNKWHAAVKALILMGMISLSIHWLNRSMQVEHVDMLPTVAVWDLAQMSLYEDELLIPPYALRDGTITLKRLSEISSPVSNVPLCSYTKNIGREVYCMGEIPLRHGEGLPPGAASALAQDWLKAIARHPRAYFSHRWHMSCNLLDLCHDSGMAGFGVTSFQPDELSGDWYDGPSAASLGIRPFAAPSLPGARIIDGLIWLRFNTLVLSPWPYLIILGVTTLCFGLGQKRNPQRPLARAIIASGWLMTIPLFFITPSLQFRYLIWPILCAIISVLMVRRR